MGPGLETQVVKQFEAGATLESLLETTPKRDLLRALVTAEKQQELSEQAKARLGNAQIDASDSQRENQIRDLLSILNCDAHQDTLLHASEQLQTSAEIGQAITENTGRVRTTNSVRASLEKLHRMDFLTTDKTKRRIRQIKGFRTTTFGACYGQPLVAFTQKYVQEHQATMQYFFGNNTRPTSLYNRLRTAELVASGVRTAGAITRQLQCVSSVTRENLIALEKVGVVMYDGREPTDFTYEWTEQKGEVEAVNRLNTLTQKVAAWMQENKKATAAQVNEGVRYHRPITVRIVLTGLLNQGFVTNDFPDGHSRAILGDKASLLLDYSSEVRKIIYK